MFGAELFRVKTENGVICLREIQRRKYNAQVLRYWIGNGKHFKEVHKETAREENRNTARSGPEQIKVNREPEYVGINETNLTKVIKMIAKKTYSSSNMRNES